MTDEPTLDVVVGGSVSGNIDFDGDTDNITVFLVSGQTYLISLRGTGANPIRDSFLQMRNPSNAIIASVTDDDGGNGLYSFSTYTATATGNYTIAATSFSNPGAPDLGQWTVDVRVQGVDAVGDTNATAVFMGPGTTFGFRETGSGGTPIDPLLAGDLDRYRVTLEAGHFYTFKLAGSADYTTNFSSPPPGTLDTFMYLTDAAGAILASNDDIAFPNDISSRFAFFAETSGTYYLNVTAYSGLTGGYIVDFKALSGLFGASAFAFNSFGASAPAGGWSSNNQYPRTAADVNGDGRADLVGFGDAATFVALANANGTFQNPIVGINSFGFSAAGGGFTSNDKYPRTLGDVNGDGRADIVGFGDAATFVALGNANGTFQAPIVGINSFGFSPAGGSFTSNNKYPRTLGDVNGDGRADIVGFGDAATFVALGNANGTFQAPILAINSFGFSPAGGGWTTNDKYPRTLGDVNGDGRADIVGFGDAGVFVSLANANGTFQNAIFALNSFGFSAAGGGWANNTQYPRMVADVNEDGRADIVGFGDTGIFVALGKANGAFDAPIADLAGFGVNAGGWSSNDLYPRTLADVNGDGATDVVGFGDAGVFVSNGQIFLA